MSGTAFMRGYQKGNGRNAGKESSPPRLCVSEVMFYLSFLLLFGYRVFGRYDGVWYYKYTLLLAAGFFALKILTTEHTVAELLCIGGLLLTAGITYARTGEKGLLLYYMMLTGMKDISPRRICRCGAYTAGAGMALLTFLTSLGFAPERIFLADDRYDWPVYRHSLGYPHTNTLLTTYIILMMLCMYLTGNSSRKTVLRRSAWFLAGTFYYWLYCDSRTGVLIACIYLALNYYYQFHAGYGAVGRLTVCALYPAICVFTIGGSTVFYPAEAPAARWLFSFWDRFRLTHYYMQEYPLTWFGVRITIPENESYGLDVAQVHLLLNLGVAAFIIVSILYAILLADCLRNRRSGELPIILCLLIMGVTDPLLYNLSCKNLTFLFMGASLYRLFDHLNPRLPAWLTRKVRCLPAGGQELPRLAELADVLQAVSGKLFASPAHAGQWLVSAGIAAAGVLAYAGYGHSRIEPLEGSYALGVREFCLRLISVGVFSFLISFSAMRLAAGKQELRDRRGLAQGPSENGDQEHDDG